ncbi:hypothetical protein Clacol_003740 [Clathrus columnatus]|uniref:FAM192A/Fyv6 N-terminal domain-containing protein n=1 Tax=Clathrus columnatus TaxID=1419009 RepID=A0AAV5A779_9AGAM|nr:hypothetical protein Clacol_003740 [Clathrus columnatus]
MADIPALSSGGVNSRFVSQTEIEEITKRREEQWKAAYARLGQEPPERPQEEAYDGRSLAEKLAANKAAQQEEWEQKMKLSNQFRSLEEDEILFLDSVRVRQLEEERKRKKEDGEELKNFREAVAARNQEVSGSTTTETPVKLPSVPHNGKTKSVISKKDNRLKGVVVKKKFAPNKEKSSITESSTSQAEDGERNAKRQKHQQNEP